MAKEMVLRSCGHEEEHNLLGPRKDREYRKNWLKGTVCKSCYQQSQLQASAELGLPLLEGSEKQIKWACSIRLAVVENLNKLSSWIDTNRHKDQSLAGEADVAIATLKSQSSCRFWIDHRNDDLGTLTWLQNAVLRMRKANGN